MLVRRVIGGRPGRGAAEVRCCWCRPWRTVRRLLPQRGDLRFTNDTFARHCHDAFVGQAVTAIDRELADHAVDDDSGWIRWLTSRV